MQDATENQDISATQAALAESMAQLQMISKMRGKKG
jgi:F-type H+-transporting ATPase subunit epsilon